MIALRERRGKDADHRFAELPWDEHTSRWQEIDRCLPADHLARQIAEAIEELDLAGLFATYTGRGSKALWPDLLLRLVLYEMHRGRQSPAEWFLDAKESEPLQWLLFGMKPSRTVLYEFLDRLENFWDDWNRQTLRRAQAQGQTLGNRAALDGTLIAALASRHRMVNQKTLADRLEKLQQAVAANESGSCPRREACTPSSERGRSVSRLEHEDLVDALRARMETAEAKKLYKQRSQTIELRYADLKAHRRLRRFNHYGPRRTRAQVGAAILAYNLLILQKNREWVKFSADPMIIPEKVPPKRRADS